MTFSIIKTKAQLDSWLKKQKNPIYFVPTMGGLHLGHAELIKAAKKHGSKNSCILVSIFVNPLQFGANEDFEQYPRNLSLDSEIAKGAGANAIWAPSEKDIFQGDKNSLFQINVPPNLQKHLCGSKRKGHFDGVCTIMVKLLSLVKPKVLILGEKDWQQFIILRQLVNALGLQIEVKGIATVRDSNNLALSSRNQYLNSNEYNQALALPRSLQEARKNFKSKGSINIQKLRSNFEKNNLKVDYIQIVDRTTLTPLDQPKSPCLLAAAVYCGRTRLIDHTFLMTRSPIIAIDGPAGAGKSTIAQLFAKKMGLIYLDTGAMYRALTWHIIENQINPNDEKNLVKVLEDCKVDFKSSESSGPQVFVNQKNVTHFIRSPQVTEFVSKISAKFPVREKLTNQQKEFGQQGGIVAEGRDIGTAVFPDAELKIFLTASTSERAKRRALDLKQKGFEVPSLMLLEQQIKERDQADMERDISPLVKAADAKELITDGMKIEVVLDELTKLFREEVPEEMWKV